MRFKLHKLHRAILLVGPVGWWGTAWGMDDVSEARFRLGLWIGRIKGTFCPLHELHPSSSSPLLGQQSNYLTIVLREFHRLLSLPRISITDLSIFFTVKSR